MRVRTLTAGLVAMTALAGTTTVAVTQAPASAKKDEQVAPLVIGHRGASGYRPEHTLAAYQLAIDLGADVIEPDLVSTKDGVLVARHENEIGGTTDISTRPEFAALRTTKTIDGSPITGWFTEDLTLAELKTLRAKERIPALRQESTIYDGRFEVPTLAEVLGLVRAQSKATGRTIAVIPETKHPTYFDSIGLSLEEPLVRTLERFGYRDEKDAAIIQSFEVANLVELNERTDLRLVQLYGGASSRPYDFTASGDPRTYRDLATAPGLQGVARYADITGPEKSYVIPVQDGALGAPTSFVRDAHAAGLQVTPYTFRAENQFLPPALRSSSDPAAFGDVIRELTAFYAAGVDGVFTDQPDVAVEARRAFLAG